MASARLLFCLAVLCCLGLVAAELHLPVRYAKKENVNEREFVSDLYNSKEIWLIEIAVGTVYLIIGT